MARYTSLTMRPAAYLALILLATGPIFAQMSHKGPEANIARSKTIPPYDVISVKQSITGADDGNINIDDHGLLTVTNMPLWWIMEFAYDVKQEQIVGLPGSINDARFNITAKILPPDAGPAPEYDDADMQAKIILLLQNRFHLKAHLEPRIKPVYDLVVTKGGLKIKLSPDEIKSSHWNINGENTLKVLTGSNTSLSDLADQLSDVAGRKVIDKTGIAGHADITLKWSDDVAQTQGGADVISIFTAVEDQLGLKLQPSKGPVTTLVVDHVEMPTAD